MQLLFRCIVLFQFWLKKGQASLSLVPSALRKHIGLSAMLRYKILRREERKKRKKKKTIPWF